LSYLFVSPDKAVLTDIQGVLSVPGQAVGEIKELPFPTGDQQVKGVTVTTSHSLDQIFVSRPDKPQHISFVKDRRVKPAKSLKGAKFLGKKNTHEG
jgi:hypothetical protein